jgi:5'(3')-deoxyribonucleotidase
VWVDIDGVLADTPNHILKFAGHEPVRDADWPRGKHATDFLIEKGLIKSEDAFWTKFDCAEFWEQIPIYSYAQTFIHKLEALALAFDFYLGLLTAPQRRPPFVGPSGKFAWVLKHFPHLVQSTSICLTKGFLAHEKAILIDDMDRNIRSFESQKGKGILWPRPWNESYITAHVSDELKIDMVLKELVEFLKMQ